MQTVLSNNIFLSVICSNVGRTILLREVSHNLRLSQTKHRSSSTRKVASAANRIPAPAYEKVIL